MKKEIWKFDVSTPERAAAFLDGEHACKACLLIGGSCGGTGFDCLTTWEANGVLLSAEAAAKDAARAAAKGADVVPDPANSPYPCGRLYADGCEGCGGFGCDAHGLQARANWDATH